MNFTYVRRTNVRITLPEGLVIRSAISYARYELGLDPVKDVDRWPDSLVGAIELHIREMSPEIPHPVSGIEVEEFDSMLDPGLLTPSKFDEL